MQESSSWKISEQDFDDSCRVRAVLVNFKKVKKKTHAGVELS